MKVFEGKLRANYGNYENDHGNAREATHNETWIERGTDVTEEGVAEETMSSVVLPQPVHIRHRLNDECAMEDTGRTEQSPLCQLSRLISN